jgi:crotonobetainyl-CoA:carnitine CoA-transferase CaiB-like acyl-CoA transferase
MREATDPARDTKKDEALDDLVVLDVSSGSMAGVVCSSVLAEFGAEVIRLEPPGGDLVRQYSPDGFMHEGTGIGYLVEGRNKLHATLDLEHAEGRALFGRLAARADVVVETYPAGVMDGWGIGYRQLREANPGLVYAAFTTYGQFGPKAGPAMADLDLCDQALSGLSSITGEGDERGAVPWAVPTKQGNWMAWYLGGVMGAFGVLAALHYRRLSGEGQMVDCSPAEALLRACSYEIPYFHGFQAVRERIGNRDVAVFPYTYVRTRDGYAFISGYTDANWAALCTIIERPELRERFPSIRERLNRENQPVIQEEIENWSSDLTFEEMRARVQAYTGPGVVAVGKLAAPAETVKDEHWNIRGAFREIEDPTYGRLVVQNPPWRMSETPARLKWVCRRPGQDNGQVYMKYLGLGPSEVERLRAGGVV